MTCFKICWRWSDPNLVMQQIHTKEVGPVKSQLDKLTFDDINPTFHKEETVNSAFEDKFPIGYVSKSVS